VTQRSDSAGDAYAWDCAADAATVAAAIARRIEHQQDRSGPVVHALRRGFSKQLRDRDARDVIRIALTVNEHDDHTFRFMAAALVFHHPGALERLSLRTIRQLGQGMDGWGDVDVFVGYIAGPAWRLGRLRDADIERWTRSKDRWWRRAALVSTVALNRKSIGGTGDVPRTLAVCRRLADDGDDMVIKALSWALRELIPHDAAAVRRFLAHHDAVLARRVVREVTCKLTTGRKTPVRDGGR
jgi:3-methyladenine DNA glycosylase AlkD